MKQQQKRIAVFDIDGTIFRSSLLIELINALIAEGIFPKRAQKEMEQEYLAWSNRKGTYAAYLEKVIGIHLKYIKGCKVADVERVAHRVIDWEQDRVYVFTRDLIRKLKKQGYILIAISGSPDYIVALFTGHMDFNAAFGARYETKNGTFTGEVTNKELWTDKAGILKSYLEQEHLQVDFERSVAVGDTETDIAILRLVGRPIAFNPNLELARHAQKKDWSVVVERKDVVYTIVKFSLKS